jgi:signal transduction histidine kinase
VIIEGVAADRASIAIPAGHEGPEAHVVVPAGSRVVEFQFTGISLAAPEGVRFRYRLADLESEFVDVSDRRTAAYSYLPPGNYRFEVMARNSDGVWSAPGTAVAVTVLPRAWETWWFRTALAGLALMIAAGIARQIATRDMRRNLARVEQQRAIERDRARIAKDIHDDLGAGLTQISLLSELLRDDSPHEAKVHVDQIGETAAELTRAMDEIVWAVNPSEDTLESLWDYLSHFAHEYLGAAGIACRLEAPPAIPVQSLRAEVRHNVFLAVKEALNNVVKHAAASEVRLDLDVRASGFVVEVTDDGHGMIASTAPTKLRTATGHGLRNLTERLTSIGGRCEITPGPQGGTRVRLEVPLS